MRTPYVAFVRNVMHGRKGLSQASLLEAFSKHGAVDPVTHLTTGNVSFELDSVKLAEYKEKVENELGKILPRREPVFIRSLEELQTLNFNKIFKDYLDPEVYERCVSFLETEPMADFPFLKKNRDVEVFTKVNNSVFCVTRLVNKNPGSPNLFIEKTFGQPASTRNINTLIRILKRLKDP